MKKNYLIIIGILLVGIFLRLYQLNTVPPGLNIDEASFGFNSYSLLLTAEDRYGHILPLMFRSFGTYLLPLYTYLTIIPIAFFGPSIFSARLVAGLSSILVIIATAILAFKFYPKSYKGKILIFLLISISPWAIYLGRGSHEASLSLGLFVLSILCFMKSLANPKWIIFTFLFAGFASISYYTERYLSFILFPVLVWAFKEKLFKHKKFILFGVLIFLLFQTPNLLLLNSDSFSRRIDQVNYWNDGGLDYIIREFITHYLEYFSPASLFSKPDDQAVRSIPDLSVFYSWMVIPMFFGFAVILKNFRQPYFKVLLLLALLSPIPAALTKDPFYTIRAMTFLWVLTQVIAIGADFLLSKIRLSYIQLTLLATVLIISLSSFCISYFIFLKHERSNLYGYEYLQLTKKLQNYKDTKIVIDSSRAVGAHIWLPFYAKIDPQKIQIQDSEEIKKNYYNDTNLDIETKFDNVEIRPIFWFKDLGEKKILVGDFLAISDQQIEEHKLKFIFQVEGLDGKVKLKAYQTNVN